MDMPSTCPRSESENFTVSIGGGTCDSNQVMRRCHKKYISACALSLGFMVTTMVMYGHNSSRAGESAQSGPGKIHLDAESFSTATAENHSITILTNSSPEQIHLDPGTFPPTSAIIHPIPILTDSFLPTVHLAAVCCGDRFQELIVMLKSVRLLGVSNLVFHIFAEIYLQEELKRQLDAWPKDDSRTVEYKIYNPTFPNTMDATSEQWKYFFRPCASQRLFFPDLLKDVDALLYLDTDTLLLKPPEDAWAHFKNFNSSQIMAMVQNDVHDWSFYAKVSLIPFYQPFGVNSGMIMMNLTRMRELGWFKLMTDYFREYKYRIDLIDQDLMNIHFHFHPDQLYVHQCNWNYRADHCWNGQLCRPAETEGVYVLHGNRGVFHNNWQLPFRAVYETFRNFNIGDDPRLLTQRAMEAYEYTKNTNTKCGKIPEIFFRQLRRSIGSMQKKHN